MRIECCIILPSVIFSGSLHIFPYGQGVTPESGRIEREQLRPGDHIYTWRTQKIPGHKIRLYAHHGIYESDVKVIQITWTKAHHTVATVNPAPGAVQLNLGAAMQKKLCPKCGGAKRQGDVVVTCLDCFLGTGKEKDELCLFAYGVPKWFYDQSYRVFRQPTCSMEPEDPVKEALSRANDLLNNGGARCNYDLLHNNCFHLAFYCKTGKDYHHPVALGVEISTGTWEELLNEPQSFGVAVKTALQMQAQ
ncbi:unnamed protein product [Urochloa decumbens]|uniref:LRAT domain-containing protein n=1 Tax=Urochloa decumbens TaxID=240449 RepID=A0ABC8VLM8_9POAL